MTSEQVLTKEETILVTGGAGFIGTNLCIKLLEQGKKVICFDNLISSNTPTIFHLNYTFFEGDVIYPIPIYCHLDKIYHLACAASPPKYQTNPIHTIRTCVVGTMNVLELAKKNKCPILFTSTSEIYGEPLVSPQPESYRGNVNCNGIRACYDEGKRMAETIMFEYHRLYQVDIKVARLFNTYGMYMNPSDGRVITNLLMQHIRNKPFTIYGDGSQSRSFCFIDDMIRGLIFLMESKETGPINLGNPSDGEISVLQLAKMIDPTREIIFKPLPSDDPTNRCPDITLAKQKLGWKPEIPLSEGLQKTLEYLRQFD